MRLFKRKEKKPKTTWLDLKRESEKRLKNYEGQNHNSVKMLVKRFGELCIEIEGCGFFDSKRGSFLSQGHNSQLIVWGFSNDEQRLANHAQRMFRP